MVNYPNLKGISNVNPAILKERFFNGEDGPNLNLMAIYELFRREDFPTIRIGRKLFAPTHLFIKWWDGQASGGANE
ncbi:MAG TPA: hypothetical protein DDZ91_03475 [Firmicutes bacterium]|nr:hypothetical protein [Bacillota bacterium]